MIGIDRNQGQICPTKWKLAKKLAKYTQISVILFNKLKLDDINAFSHTNPNGHLAEPRPGPTPGEVSKPLSIVLLPQFFTPRFASTLNEKFIYGHFKPKKASRIIIKIFDYKGPSSSELGLPNSLALK